VETLATRAREADEFYRSVIPPSMSPDAANVMRQAVAGMLWSKQYYSFDGDRWLQEHHAHPLRPGGRPFRNREWFHMVNDDVISMPDKWDCSEPSRPSNSWKAGSRTCFEGPDAMFWRVSVK